MSTSKPGEVLRDARLARGLTQEQLAVKIGRSQSGIDHWEAGRRTPPRPITEKLDRALKAGGRVMRAFGYAPDRARTPRPMVLSPPAALDDEELEQLRFDVMQEITRQAQLLEEVRAGARADAEILHAAVLELQHRIEALEQRGRGSV